MCQRDVKTAPRCVNLPIMTSPCNVQTTIPVPRTSGRVVSLSSFFCAGATPLGERTVVGDAGNFSRKYHTHLTHSIVLCICRISAAQLSILVEICLLHLAICSLTQLWSRSLQGVNKSGIHWFADYRALLRLDRCALVYANCCLPVCQNRTLFLGQTTRPQPSGWHIVFLYLTHHLACISMALSSASPVG